MDAKTCDNVGIATFLLFLLHLQFFSTFFLLLLFIPIRGSCTIGLYAPCTCVPNIRNWCAVVQGNTEIVGGYYKFLFIFSNYIGTRLDKIYIMSGKALVSKISNTPAK